MTDGYLKSGSMTSISLVAAVPERRRLIRSGRGRTGCRFALNAHVLRRGKSMPVLPYWFESHTYGVRPVNRPMPPRTCSVPSPLSA